MRVFRYLKYGVGAIGCSIAFKRFMEKKLTSEECRNIIKNRMHNRDKLFLDFLKKFIFDYQRSPYLRLFKYTGCSLDKIRGLVYNYGIESTLQRLQQREVFFTIDEFRCEKVVKRGNKTFEFQVEDFDNPYIKRFYRNTSTGATKSRGIKTKINTGHLLQRSIYEYIMLEEHNCKDYPVILWYPTPPANTGFYPVRLRKMGVFQYKWYSPVKIESINFKRKLGEVVYNSIVGKNLPFPEYLSPDNAEVILEDIVKLKKKYSRCSVHTYVGLAVNICNKAQRLGLDLQGVCFFGSGEYISLARRKVIESIGAYIVPTYYFTEAGIIGCGCKEPYAFSDSIHLFNDSLAVITYNKRLKDTGEEIPAILFTNFHPDSPKIMFNTENGDYSNIGITDCNCSLYKLGFSTQLYNIRSFDKLTMVGMSLAKNELINIVENELPQRFGGSSCDYQICESLNDGNRRLTIIVSPDINNIDEGVIKEFFLELLKKKSTVIFNIWKGADAIDVARSYPVRTKIGKLLPVYIKV